MKETDYEKAARELCRLRGIDPDKRIYPEAPQAWTFLVPEIKATQQVLAAIAVGNGFAPFTGIVIDEPPAAGSARG